MTSSSQTTAQISTFQRALFYVIKLRCKGKDIKANVSGWAEILESTRAHPSLITADSIYEIGFEDLMNPKLHKNVGVLLS